MVCYGCHMLIIGLLGIYEKDMPPDMQRCTQKYMRCTQRYAKVRGHKCKFGGSGGNHEDIWALMGVPWSAMGVICLS
jgi:hypothetical protein